MSPQPFSRRYSAGADFALTEYYLPNDERERERLGNLFTLETAPEAYLTVSMPDINHNMWLLGLRGELGLSPKAQGGSRRVLDLGTGNGAWAMDFGMLPASFKDTRTDSTRHQPICIQKQRSATSYPGLETTTHPEQVIGVDLSPIQPSL